MVYEAYIIAVVVSYFLGSIPAGYLAGRAKGIDVRKVGSGNIGATNAFRVLGKKAGTAVLLVDALKGFVSARWVPLLAIWLFPAAVGQLEYLMLVAGVAAILGHNFTCWLKFKGGKGIATSAGVVMAWSPLACVVALVVWALFFFTTKYVSLASIMAAVVLPFAVWFTSHSTPMTIVMGALSAMAIYKHKANMQRLFNGTESRVGGRKEEKK